MKIRPLDPSEYAQLDPHIKEDVANMSKVLLRLAAQKKTYEFERTLQVIAVQMWLEGKADGTDGEVVSEREVLCVDLDEDYVIGCPCCENWFHVNFRGMKKQQDKAKKDNPQPFADMRIGKR